MFANDEVWIQGILSFVGFGQYAFVGAVNKRMNRFYKAYCEIELKKKPRLVKRFPDFPGLSFDRGRSAEITDTLYSETFYNEPRAEYWLRDNSTHKTPGHDQVCTAIATVGSHTVMQWARKQGFPWNEGTCFFAAKNGHLEMLQWLRSNGCPWDETTCAAAAEGGHFEILKWARENGCPWTSDTCARAAKTGHLDILKWARANGCPWDEWTCAYAAENGHLEILKWARENGCPGHQIHVPVLQNWTFGYSEVARANGCPWDESTCARAAGNGHLEILKWARENGCPWNIFTCSGAAQGGHLEILMWARANGCRWDAYTCSGAAEGGHLKILHGLVKMGVHGMIGHLKPPEEAEVATKRK
ncbi:ankyrin repeat protein [Seminavis robusta]|uniref:Ankyrin repeat protein n=1 Tax=Seminavis robusta TaxID=568900 RepID=A0A9N8DAP8_9STRA|nr:ankyrin repeat protein [Seminavis robusta]|eukprot:Sro3_g002240.1 ankyrin repeat protein (359) ;mRNA; r:97426-98584